MSLVRRVAHAVGRDIDSSPRFGIREVHAQGQVRGVSQLLVIVYFQRHHVLLGITVADRIQS